MMATLFQPIRSFVLLAAGTVGGWFLPSSTPPWLLSVAGFCAAFGVLAFLSAVRQRRQVLELESPSKREQVRTIISLYQGTLGHLQAILAYPNDDFLLTDETRKTLSEATEMLEQGVYETLRKVVRRPDLAARYRVGAVPRVTVADAEAAGCSPENVDLWILLENRIRRINELFDRVGDQE